jgi:hypothetical protein
MKSRAWNIARLSLGPPKLMGAGREANNLTP